MYSMTFHFIVCACRSILKTYFKIQKALAFFAAFTSYVDIMYVQTYTIFLEKRDISMSCMARRLSFHGIT